ncbi:MAG: DUF4032 domain-containing protein [Deinococcota bacterium]
MSYLADRQARRDAERVRSRAFWHQVLMTVRGIPNELVPFSAVRQLRPSSEHYGGVKPIAIDKIIGSVDKYRDFDHYFLPRLSYTLDRWIGIRRAGLEGKELPPIEAYKVGEVYFVKDGHHRVSVARSSGQKFIDADIIELSVKVPPDSTDSLKTLIIKGEYSQFLEHTNLNHVRPEHYPVVFTVTGRYDILLTHVRTRQYYLAEARQQEVNWDEAVGLWYNELYQPIVDEIREHNVMDRFPGRTEADLYLWIMDHRYYLVERYGNDVSSHDAAVDFAKNHAPVAPRRWWQRARYHWRGRALE